MEKLSGILDASLTLKRALNPILLQPDNDGSGYSDVSELVPAEVGYLPCFDQAAGL